MFFIERFKQYKKEIRDASAKRFRKIVLSVPFFVTVIGLVLVIASSILGFLHVNARKEQKISEVWAGTDSVSYRYMAVYAGGYRSGGATSPMLYQDASTSLSSSDVTTIRASLQSAVDSGTNTSKTKSSDGTPVGWEDCWSTWLTSTVSYSSGDSSSKATTVDVETVAVGGNYKAFHPFEYMAGGFLPEVCVDQTQIVINDVLSWRLFKSYDVTGNVLTMNGKIYTIVGVVREGTSKFDLMAGSDNPRVYMYFSELQNCSSDISAAADNTESAPTTAASAAAASNTSDSGDSTGVQKLAIGCYEALLPEVVAGVAKTDMQTALPTYSAADPHMYVVSITGRYSIPSVWDFMLPFGENDEKLASYDFPYWEKAEQLTQKYLFADEIIGIAGILCFLSGTASLIIKSKKFNKVQS